MALELRNLLEDSLGLAFPVTLIWNHQSIAALAEHLIERMELGLAPEAAEPEIAPEDSSDLAALLSAIGELSLDELQQVLDAEPMAQGDVDE